MHRAEEERRRQPRPHAARCPRSASKTHASVLSSPTTCHSKTADLGDKESAAWRRLQPRSVVSTSPHHGEGRAYYRRLSRVGLAGPSSAPSPTAAPPPSPRRARRRAASTARRGARWAWPWARARGGSIRVGTVRQGVDRAVVQSHRLCAVSYQDLQLISFFKSAPVGDDITRTGYVLYGAGTLPQAQRRACCGTSASSTS